ncbi:MAG: putative iron-regulated membrane protein [Planctomycetota bacterium]|jgi:uncharacterized iron-regulated membrane protein
MTVAKFNRKLHRWGAILAAAPVLVILLTGLVLQLKKEVSWIQPPTARSEAPGLMLGFDEILEAVSQVSEAGISSWDDVDRLDVRPGRGVVKVRGNNRWEVQLDATTGEVLASSYRRSDLIESLHDGSWFHDKAKLWLFLPASVILLGLWFTGIYLWFLPHLVRRRRKHKQA